MAHLAVVQGPGRGAVYALKAEATVGRSAECEIRLEDAQAAAKHALIARSKAGYRIAALAEDAAVLVNGKPVQARLLAEGDEIQLGDVALRFSLKEAPAAPPRPARAFAPSAGERKEDAPTRRIVVDDKTGAEAQILHSVDAGARADKASSGIITATSPGERLELAFQVGNFLGMAMGVDELVQTCTQYLLDFFSLADRAGLLLKTPEGGYETRAVRLRSGDEGTLKVSTTLIRHVAGKRMGVVTADAQDDSRLMRAASIVGKGLRSVLCAPLLWRGEVTGLAYLESASQRGIFAQDDLRLLTLIGQQIASGIKNAEMHRMLKEQERLEQELQIAREIQQCFLGPTSYKVRDLVLQVRSRPAQLVCGDVYDVTRVGDYQVGVLIGDVAGQGVPAALYTAALLSQFRVLCQSAHDPADLLSQLNSMHVSESVQHMHASLLYLLFDVKKREVVGVNAGHFPPLLVSPVHRTAVPMDMPDYPPVGRGREVQFKAQRLKYPEEDFFVLYTDGLVDAKDRAGRIFGPVRLMESARQVLPQFEPAPERLMNDLAAFTGDVPQADDVTVMAVASIP